MSEYRLKQADLSKLSVHKVDNPYYKKAAPMQLYLLTQIQELSQEKWGSPEPYIVTCANFSPQHLQRFVENTERLKQLSPGEFQDLIADRLDHMGLGVQLVGDINRKDGGVDIVAYPNTGCNVPFLLAVQVKHHRKNRKTGAADVRDLHGVITSRNSPFHIGMLVTNTTFTADAKWVAENNKTLLRLRDIQDLCRWLKDDFVNEYEWREIPTQIELAPGIQLEIPRPKLWLPSSHS
jgi:hypothetical protein